MPVYGDFLPPGDYDSAAEWFKGEGGGVENTRMPEHKHFCVECNSWWLHAEPCEYGGPDVGEHWSDWPCPMCIEKGAPE